MSQFVAPLRDNGIELTIRPFLDSERFAKLYSHGKIHGFTSLILPLCSRVLKALQMGNYHLFFIQREAMIFGPAVFEWIYQQIGRLPVVLDLDDATYVSYVSPRF